MSEAAIDRVARSKQDAKATYDRLSRWYDVLAGSSERGFLNACLAMLEIREGEAVLEIGPGTGHGLVSLAGSVGDMGRVYGLDLSQGMLAVAWRRFLQTGLLDRVELQRGDAAHLPFAARCFDAVLMAFTLELFDTPEIPQVLGECWRVLRHNGRIGVVALSKADRTGFATRLYEWAHRRFPRYIDCRPIHLQDALRESAFETTDMTIMSMWGLPVSIATARKAASESPTSA
jgi:demethylmenaquinone methyltransferase/2-methoxy-6-polyprenyl-1,4-benzoquinol methylase